MMSTYDVNCRWLVSTDGEWFLVMMTDDKWPQMMSADGEWRLVMVSDV